MLSITHITFCQIFIILFTYRISFQHAVTSSVSRTPLHSCCEMRVMQCMTYFFCTSLQFCTPFRSAQKLYQHPIDIHFFIRFSLTVAKIIILCFYLFPRKCFMFFFQIRNDICDSLSSKRTCHKYLLTASES